MEARVIKQIRTPSQSTLSLVQNLLNAAQTSPDHDRCDCDRYYTRSQKERVIFASDTTNRWRQN